MSLQDMNLPFVIHIGLGERTLAKMEGEARSHGMSVVRLTLAGLPGRKSLVDYLAREFMFPHEVAGLDAAVDLISDLEWFGNPNGYLVVARGLAEGSEVGEAFVSMLPNIVDRWRSQNVPFIVVTDSTGCGLQSVLAVANQEMARAGELPWAQSGTGPVDVIVHEVGKPGPGAR